MSPATVKRARWWLLIVLLISVTLVADQFLLTREERSVYLGQDGSRERHSTLVRGRWSSGRPAHRWSRWRTGATWYTVHLDNGRWFQLGEHQNGLLQEGDSVRIEVAGLSGRVLRYQRLSRGHDTTRTSGDAYEDLVPFPFVLFALSLWARLIPAHTDRAHYLEMLVMIIGTIFLVALFAVTLPLFRSLGWL